MDQSYFARRVVKGKLEVAKNMISLAIDTDVIAKSTGLTKEQIDDIRSSKH